MGEEYCNKADIWSIGITTFFLLYGFLPFDSDQDSKIMKRVVNEIIDLDW